jgi:hypothetical protein
MICNFLLLKQVADPGKYNRGAEHCLSGVDNLVSDVDVGDGI